MRSTEHGSVLGAEHVHFTGCAAVVFRGLSDGGLLNYLVGVLTSSSSTRLYRGQVPGQTSDNFTCYHTRDGAGRP